MIWSNARHTHFPFLLDVSVCKQTGNVKALMVQQKDGFTWRCKQTCLPAAFSLLLLSFSCTHDRYRRMHLHLVWYPLFLLAHELHTCISSFDERQRSHKLGNVEQLIG